MKNKKMTKGLSLVLAFVICVSGIVTVPEVYAATAASVEPMQEVIREEAEKSIQLMEEDELEYLEEPEDYSWMEKILEEMYAEDAEEDNAEEAAVLQGGVEVSPVPAEEAEGPGEDVEIFRPFSEENGFADGEQAADPACEFAAIEFEDGADEVFCSPDEETQLPQEIPENSFQSGEEEPLFTSGGDTGTDSMGSEIGESEGVLHLDEGDDFVTELNILLYKVKDLATDDHPYKVIIPPGNYEIKGTISIYSNIHLYAVGAVMKKTSSKKQILLRFGNSEVSVGGYDGYRNITIEGGTWDCNYESCANKEAPGGFVGFRMGHATNVTIKDATFLNNLKSHFLEFGGVKHGLVTGCTFEGYWTPHETTGQECIQIDACMNDIFPRYQPFDGTVCTDIVIENNVFQNVFAGAGSHSMMFNKPYTNIVVRNNKFINVKKNSVWLLYCKDSEVSGNVMTNVGGGVYISSMRATHAKLLSGQKPAIKQNQQSLNVVVSNNQITLAQTTTIAGRQWSSYGIWIGGQRVTNAAYGIPTGDYIIRGVTADGNVIKGPGNGIRLERTINCNVTNNHLSLSKPDGYTNLGIYAGGSRNNQITYNVVENPANVGIYLYTNSGYTHKSTGNKLVRNQVKKGGSDGIRVSAASDNTVLQNNILRENKKNGITVQNSVIASMVSNKGISNGNMGIYCSSSTIKAQQKNAFEGNKSVYVLRFYKCKGQIQNVKNIMVDTVKRTSKKVTGTGIGSIRAYVYTTANKQMGKVKIGKNSRYSVPIKAQKKGTVLSVRVTDKYGNLVKKSVKVV